MDAGKAPFARYAESGQVLVDRGRHLDALEWAWFLNAFGDGHVYDRMYGDKVTKRVTVRVTVGVTKGRRPGFGGSRVGRPGVTWVCEERPD